MGSPPTPQAGASWAQTWPSAATGCWPPDLRGHGLSDRGSYDDTIEERQILPPSPEQLASIRNRIRESIAAGTHGERKALLQELVAEVRVESRRAIVPVFRLPLWGPSDQEGAVRDLFRLVDPGSQNKNPAGLLTGPVINLANIPGRAAEEPCGARDTT